MSPLSTPRSQGSRVAPARDQCHEHGQDPDRQRRPCPDHGPARNSVRYLPCRHCRLRDRKVLESLPPEINVMNTAKIPIDNDGHVLITGRPETAFDTYHVATVDSEIARFSSRSRPRSMS